MTTLTREELYEMVWTKPVTKIAAELNVSATAIAKICKQLTVPRPPRGYWARLRHGYEVHKPPLPKATANTRIKYVLDVPEFQWQKRGPVRVPKKADFPEVSVPEKTGRYHPAVATLKARYASARKDDFGRVGRQNKAIHVTPSSLRRSYRLLNALFRELERRGHRVSERDGVIEMRVGGEIVEASLFEPTTRTDNPKVGGYPRWLYHATGRLMFTVSARDSYRIRRQWADGKTASLEDRLGKMVVVVEQMPVLVRAERRDKQAQEERWARARLRRKRENDAIKFARARAQTIDQLVRDLDKAKRIRVLAGEIERQAAAPSRSRRLARWAKKYADHLDPRVDTRLVLLDLEPDKYAYY